MAPLVLAVLFVLYWGSISEALHTFGHTIGRPLWSLQSTVSESFSSTYFVDREQLIEENKALQKEVTALRRHTFTTRSIAQDNAHLRELLERNTDESYRIPVTVIHGIVYSPYDSFIIDRGASHGIRDGMLVLSPEKIAIGYIQAAHEHTSSVELFSASNLRFDAIVHSATTSVLHINVQGLGGGSIQASVPRDVTISVDDEVSLPSFETYPVGRIVKVEGSPEDAFKTLYIQNPVNVFELRYALVDTVSVWKAPEESLRLETNATPSDE